MSEIWMPGVRREGYQETMQFNDKGECTGILHDTPDMEGTISLITNIRNDTEKRYGNKRSMTPVAEIPPEVLIDWKLNHDCDLITRANEEDLKKAKVLLNGDYKYLKVKPVRL